jgi:hypothetical protein|tara:strand:- start:467 stop:1600 length:1134 start_codon:yes stop_codon:yes gene_type:complete
MAQLVFEYKDIVRKPNPMRILNPLAKASNEVVDLLDRVGTLERSNSWKKLIKQWREQGKTLDPNLLPKVARMGLGKLDIANDIQRQLDAGHCANTIANPARFMEQLVQALNCVVTSDGKWLSIDGQHTATVLASLIRAGLVKGVDADTWRDFEVNVLYVETDDLAFARKAFGILNGKGKKRQSAYSDLRTSVYVVRIDKNTDDEEDVAIERKVSIAEKYDCYPVEEKSSLNQHPGTFTNVGIFKARSDKVIKQACKWHNEYFHQDNIHVSLFFMFDELAINKAKLTDKFLRELAGMIQNIFVDLDGYAGAVKDAFRKFTKKQYGEEMNWRDDAYMIGLSQLYKELGGTERVPQLLLDTYSDLHLYFADEIVEYAKAA